MYLPKHFKEERPELLIPFIQEHPLGVLVTIESGLAQANHLPWFYEEQTLQAHIPKVNPLYTFLRESNKVEALLIFQGPQAYITPSWYPSKKETGKVVPTWNYSVVHVRGKIQIQENKDWIRSHLEKMTNAQEVKRNSDWEVSDAPVEFTDGMISVLCGLEFQIESIEGKLKLSQNRLKDDHKAVLDHLSGSDIQDDRELAALAMQALSKK